MMSFLKKSVLLFAFAASVMSLSAAPWSALGPKRVPETLVIVSNYKTPRLLAELIQNECRAPYILLPTLESGDKRVFFCPPKKNSLQVREARFNAFVRFLNPKRIIVIGNDKAVNMRFIDMLDRTIPIVRIEGKDWYRIAQELNFMLNLSHLDSNFKRLYEIMLNDGMIYRPVSLPGNAGQEKNLVPPAENKRKSQDALPAPADEKKASAPAAAPAA